jgi:hypothetical protein
MDGGMDDGAVYCMAEAPNGDIYIGGTFTGVNSVANTGYLAKWDGSGWEAVGTPAFVGPSGNPYIKDIMFDANGDLYVAGYFLNAGGVANADYFAKCSDPSGTPTWSALGSGIDAAVNTITIDGDGTIYIGGAFTTAGGDTDCNKIAYYDTTTSNWKPLSTGLNAGVQSLAVSPNDDIYVGGSFTDAAYPYICYWDGSSFNPVGTAGDINNEVYKIGFGLAGLLNIGGSFTNAGGNADADYLARFNGNQWSNIGTGLNGAIRSMIFPESGGLYIAGLFSEVAGLDLSDRVAYYANGAWRMLDIDLPGSGVIYSIFIDSRDNLYIGGDFSTTDDGNAVTSKVAANVENYGGSANGYPFIQIHGPGVLQTIVNWSSKKAIQFNGLTLQAGEWLNLTLDPHNVKVISGWRGNCLKYIIPGSDIANFYLTPSNVFKNGQAGQNNIGVLMPSGTTSNSAGWLDWRPKYWSIEGAKYE